MAVIMRVYGAGTRALTDESFDCPTWVRSYDIEGFDGYGYVEFTQDRAEALRFTDFGDAMEKWRTQSDVRPLRADGKPNRPLTALTIEVEPE